MSFGYLLLLNMYYMVTYPTLELRSLRLVYHGSVALGAGHRAGAVGGDVWQPADRWCQRPTHRHSLVRGVTMGLMLSMASTALGTVPVRMCSAA